MRLPAENAYIVALQLQGTGPGRQLGDSVVGPTLKGGVTIVDLNRSPTAWIADQMDELQFYISGAALDEMTETCGSPGIQSLRSPNGKVDAVIDGLGGLLLPALDAMSPPNPPFTEQVTLAVCAYVARMYGGLQAVGQPLRSGLAPWQERRAKAILISCLDRKPSLADVARQCQLSLSYFARAFRQSTGEPPHRWLAGRRVERAKSLLLESDRSLVEIALSCGFGDQTHFTKVFSRTVGVSPGAWRRASR
jgi:AraC family transcriptional regulator